MICEYVPEIRFSDIDAMGHVNNAVYLSYFEQARMAFFRQLINMKWDWNKQGILLARNEVDYKLPILLNDDVVIETRCTHMGTKSLTFNYNIFKRTGDQKILASSGASVLVCFDSSAMKTIPVPEVWRDLIPVSSE